MYWLGVPLSEDMGLQRIEEVSCVGGDIHRLIVRYVGGKEVWVNRSDEPWQRRGRGPAEVRLSRPGQPGRSATSCSKAGQPLETMRAGDVLYVDFRGQRRTYEGVEADGAVLLATCRGGIEIVPLGGNTRTHPRGPRETRRRRRQARPLPLSGSTRMAAARAVEADRHDAGGAAAAAGQSRLAGRTCTSGRCSRRWCRSHGNSPWHRCSRSHSNRRPGGG